MAQTGGLLVCEHNAFAEKVILAKVPFARFFSQALPGDHLIYTTRLESINREGAIVRMPVKGREGLVEINSKKLPGKLSAGGTTAFKPADYHLVALAMQEPQYRSPGVRELMDAARS